MPKYVGSRRYVKGKEVEYINCVLSHIKKHEGKEKVLRKAMKVLIGLSGKRLSSPVLGNAIVSQTGHNSPIHGLWAWVDWYGTKNNWKTGAGIVVRTQSSLRTYLIKEEFRLALTTLRPAIVQRLCLDGC